MTALLLADAEPETRGFLERHLPEDGFELVSAHAQFDLVLASHVDDVDRFAPSAPVIVLGPANADTVDCVHAFRRGCDDYVARPFDYQELVAPFASSRTKLLHLIWLGNWVCANRRISRNIRVAANGA